MVMTLVVAVLAGLSASALATALWPPRIRPDEAVTTGSATGGEASGDRSAVAARALAATGVRYPSAVGAWAARRGAGIRVQAADLAISGHDHDNVLTAKILAALASGLSALALGVVANRALGTGLPGVSVLVLALLFATAAYLIPDAVVRARARARRGQFEQALPVWCDLAALEMAGAAAPQEALVTAAEAGTTWPALVLRDTLYRAVRARQGHWQALTDLGTRIGVDDLAQLGRLSQLVSHEGAEVRDTLIERAAGMRRRALADALGQAGQRDESMRLAVLVIAAGVILMLLYPGVVAVMNF